MINNSHLKRTLIYMLLYVYSFGLLKPIVPLVNDIVAHTLYKMQHLATVHYENGKYHLHAELASESASPANQSKSSVPGSAFEMLANHIQTAVFKIEKYFTITQTIASSQGQHELDVCIKNPIPPPKA